MLRESVDPPLARPGDASLAFMSRGFGEHVDERRDVGCGIVQTRQAPPSRLNQLGNVMSQTHLVVSSFSCDAPTSIEASSATRARTSPESLRSSLKVVTS